MSSLCRCSDKHLSCSPYHAWLVSEYRVERARQEEEFDVKYGGTTEEANEHRCELVTFKSWLIASRGARSNEG